MRGSAVPVVVGIDTIFLPQTLHQLGEWPAIGFRQEGAVFVSLPVVFDQVGKLLFQEGQKNRSRAGLEEERIRVDIFASGFRGGSDQRLQIAGRIRNARKDWSTDDASVHS